MGKDWEAYSYPVNLGVYLLKQAGILENCSFSPDLPPKDYRETMDYILNSMNATDARIAKMLFGVDTSPRTIEQVSEALELSVESIRLHLQGICYRARNPFYRDLLIFGVKGSLDRIYTGTEERIRAAVIKALAEQREDFLGEINQLDKVSIESLELPLRIKNPLLRNNCKTLADVVEAGPETVFKFRGMGYLTLQAVVALLDEHGADTQPWRAYLNHLNAQRMPQEAE